MVPKRFHRRGMDRHDTHPPDSAIAVPAISGALMMSRRQAVDAVGPLDKRYFLHCEDLDWCARFAEQDWRVLFVPDALAVHHQGTCGRSRPVFVEWHKHRGMQRYFDKFLRTRSHPAWRALVPMAIWGRFAALALAHGLGLGRSGR